MYNELRSENGKKYLKALQEKRVDGIVVKPVKDYKRPDFNTEINVPFILLESWPTKEQYNIVEVDNEKGGYIATQHLIQCGYKNIAFIGGKKDS